MRTHLSLVTALLLTGLAGPLHAEVLYSVTDLGISRYLNFGVNSNDGINNFGQVTGTANKTSGSGYYAYLYTNGQIRDLGTLGGSYSTGQSINNLGQVTGWAETVPFIYNSHAFLYSNGQMQDLGTLGGQYSYGDSINDLGQVTCSRPCRNPALGHCSARRV